MIAKTIISGLQRVVFLARYRLDDLRSRPLIRKEFQRKHRGGGGFDEVTITVFLFGFRIYESQTTWQAYCASHGIE